MANMIQMPRKPDWISSFTEKMIEGAELMATGEYSNKQIAETLGMNEQTIGRRWKNNPLWMQYVNYLSTLNTLESALKIKGLTAKAVDKLGVLLKSDNDFISIRAAKEILDRAGVKDLEFDLLPKSEKKLDLDSIKNRFKGILEAERADEEIIDVTNYQTFSRNTGFDDQNQFGISDSFDVEQERSVSPVDKELVDPEDGVDADGDEVG